MEEGGSTYTECDETNESKYFDRAATINWRVCYSNTKMEGYLIKKVCVHGRLTLYCGLYSLSFPLSSKFGFRQLTCPRE